MIEVLFGESEAGSMKAAKNKVVIGSVNGPTSVWMAGKKMPPKKPFAGWIEGTAEEVICLGFMLDIGNIKEPIESLYRKDLIYSMYDQNQWESDEEMEIELKGLGDVYENELMRLKTFLDNGETILPKDEVHMFAGLWSDLVEENSPLRAVINGKVLSVPENFYDFQIWKRLTDQPIKEARLIGNILGNSQISVGDWWYAKRIEYYIEQGKICVVEDSDSKYARVISIRDR